MQGPQLQQLRARLVAARDELRDAGDIQIDPNRDDPTTTKTDEDAQPLNEMNQVIASKRNAERAARLRLIERALVRLDADPDDFGLCEACDEDIAPRRLEVMPWARFCIACQQKRDPERGLGRRSLSDYD